MSRRRKRNSTRTRSTGARFWIDFRLFYDCCAYVVRLRLVCLTHRAVLESAAIFQKKLEPWIARKVTEYFGERDETVISFVMEELEKHSSATEMIENLGEPPSQPRPQLDFHGRLWKVFLVLTL